MNKICLMKFHACWLFFTVSAISCVNSDTAPLDDVSRESDDLVFEKVDAGKSGITFSNDIVESYDHFFEFFAYVYNGGGVAVGDINNDQLPDLYFTGNQVADKIYLNKGNMRFEDITESAMTVESDGWHNGVVMCDINADGWLDIYVCRGGWQDNEGERTNLLYINQGNLTFKEASADYGLNDSGYSMQAVFFDMDNDNDIDMYLINRPDSFNLPLTKMSEKVFNAPDKNRDKLYRNDNGKYTEVSKAAGILNFGYSLGVVAADFNDDGFADIFVANDFSTSDHLYLNQGDGTFKDEIRSAMNHISLFSVGADAADINNDGLEDLMVMEKRPNDYIRSKVSMPSMNVAGFNAIVDAGMHKQYMHNMLHVNQGNSFFSEIAQLAGIAQTDWSWSGLFADLNADGFRDLYVTNGMRRDLFDGDVQWRLSQYIQEHKGQYESMEQLFEEGFVGIINAYHPIKIGNYLFKNEGGFKFRDVSSSARINEPSFSNGAIISDLDNDGDLDIVSNNINDVASVFENKTRHHNNWLKIELDGPAGNPQGLGAKISFKAGDVLYFFEQKMTRGYLSSQDPVIYAGLGKNTGIGPVKVRWPDGKVSFTEHTHINNIIRIKYKDARTEEAASESPRLFSENNSKWLDKPYSHTENEFNEFEDQVLLPHRFSAFGPKLALADLNGDGIEDFFIGGPKGQAGVIYKSNNSGWSKTEFKSFNQDAGYEDTGATFIDVDGDGDQDLYVVSGGSEYDNGHERYQDRLYMNVNGVFTRSGLPLIRENGSLAKPVDFDGDGDMDLIIGGFVRPGQYPLSVRTIVMQNNAGVFADITAEALGDLSTELGIVYDIAIADINNNGIEEVVFASEWEAINVIEWNGSRFELKTQDYRLLYSKGWWNSVKVADMDGDGDLDIIGGNLGLNYKFKVDENHEFKVFAGDFDDNGTNDIFLVKGNGEGLLPVRGKECSSQQMPGISERFPTFHSFAEADINEVLGVGIRKSITKEVDILYSCIFINENGRFRPLKLPVEAQFSLINSILVEDLNNDGRMDLILGGNRFDAEVETTPSDASTGCILINKGTELFEVWLASQTGLYLNGDVKDVQIAKGWNKNFLLVGNTRGSLEVWEFPFFKAFQ